MSRDRVDELGDRGLDRMVLRLGGQDVAFIEGYEVKTSILQQPAAFSLTCGWDKTIGQLIDGHGPGEEFQLLIDSSASGLRGGDSDDPDAPSPLRPIQTGWLDAIDVTCSAAGSKVTFRGRDKMAALFDNYVEDERTFSEKSFADLVRTALKAVGLETEAALLRTDNEANRKAITGGKTQLLPPRTVQTLVFGDNVSPSSPATGPLAQSGPTTKITYNTIKAQLGETWLNFLTRQLKLVGLFLWCTADGNFVLSEPNAKQAACTTLLLERHRQHGGLHGAVAVTRRDTNVLELRYKNDMAARHTRAVVHGRAGGGKSGRSKVRGEYIHTAVEEATGIVRKIVIHDEDARTQAEAEYIARRHLAEERRAARTLSITVSGHTFADGAPFGIWCVDSMVHVEDNQLIKYAPKLERGADGVYRIDDPKGRLTGDWYVESLTYSRNPHTTTTIELMDPTDLVFASKLHFDAAQQTPKAPKFKKPKAA